MSWDASLTDDRGHCEGDWSYTHNCNRMANEALDRAGYDRPEKVTGNVITAAVAGDHEKTEDGDYRIRTVWYDLLDGMTGADGAALLHCIVTGLEANPRYYRAMNPENGWGDYDSFLKTLTEMRDAVPEWPTVWSASG